MLLPLSASVPALWNEYLTPLFACDTQPPFRQFVIDSPSSGARTLGTHIMFVPWFGNKKQFFN